MEKISMVWKESSSCLLLTTWHEVFLEIFMWWRHVWNVKIIASCTVWTQPPDYVFWYSSTKWYPVIFKARPQDKKKSSTLKWIKISFWLATAKIVQYYYRFLKENSKHVHKNQTILIFCQTGYLPRIKVWEKMLVQWQNNIPTSHS